MKYIKNSDSDGQLKFGKPVRTLGFGFLSLVVVAVYTFFYGNDIWQHPMDMFSIIAVFVGSGLGAFVSFLEYFKTRGTYDEHGISFYTPWTGLKEEKWSDLVSLEFEESMSWYVLTFQSGKKIRLFIFLKGYSGVFELLGYDIKK